MAGICRRCKGGTTDTRAASINGLCFGCEHGMNPNRIRTKPLPGLTREEVTTLGRYNAEVDRGIVHTAEWDRQMEILQMRFDS